MIQVKELTKIYKSRKSGTCVALDHISFTLPDKGFVFVIGKSGSGKSTLLSLLGGLDTLTSGQIIEDGRDIGKLGVNEQVYYRNTTIGFIFQDFHLIEHLTIAENIMLALQLQGQNDNDKVAKALADTELSDYANRYPKELSGGQKQRVAIARALVKNPKIVLADEPTGNLDSKTTEQIMQLLKMLSREKLVVIVSHNLNDASKYADEILELSDGKILHHAKRNEQFDPTLRVENGTLFIPFGEQFSEQNLAYVAQTLSQTTVSDVVQPTNRFALYDGVPPEERQPQPLQKKHLRFGATMGLAVKLSRHGWLRLIAYAFIFAVLLVVLGLSQLIMNFDSGEVIAHEMSSRDLSCTGFIKQANSDYDEIDTVFLVETQADDLQKFRDAGFDGAAYPLINYSIFITKDTIPIYQSRPAPRPNPFEIDCTLGLLLTEPSFLEKHFGSLEYVAQASTTKNYGIYITDFVADALLKSRQTSKATGKPLVLEDLLGNTIPNLFLNNYGYINGIINTHYREKYSDIVAKVSDPSISRDQLIQLSNTEEYLAFYDEIYQYLSLSYSFEPDFVKYVTEAGARTFVSTANMTLQANGKQVEVPTWYISSDDIPSPSRKLNDDEMLMNYAHFNSLFQTNYTSSDTAIDPIEITLTYYNSFDVNHQNPRYQKTVKLVGLTSNVIRYNLADNVLYDLQQVEMFTFGWYFDGDQGQTGILFDTADANGYLPNSTIAASISTMSKAVKVFSDFFYLIFAVLCVALLLLMIQFEAKSIRDRLKDIGILKALGARNIDLIALFGFQTLVVGVLMIAMYIVGSVAFIGLANHILVLSLTEIAQDIAIMDLAFLSIKWKYIWQNCLLAFVIIAAAFVLPMLRLSTIKPSNVIKAKE